MFPFMSDLPARPADPLLGITAAFRADPRPGKIDLGVGIYRDGAGRTPVMRAVKAAEQSLLEQQVTKAYEGPRGNTGFCEAVETLVFGDFSPARAEGRVVSFTTPGGCGAIFLAMNLAARTSEAGRVWVSNPSWPNHPKVAAAAGREALAYPYIDAVTGTLDFPAMMDGLRQARPGDIVIFQGPCHNPSGIDPTLEQWRYLGDFCARQRLFPLLDVAYQGFGDGLEEDIAGIRAFLAQCPETMISYSCSKNFGLYRERTGALLVQAGTARDAEAAASHIAEIARAVYSMPPAHGAAIVESIMASPERRDDWLEELAGARTRMKSLRQALSDALVAASGHDHFNTLASQKGMFSLLPLQGPVIDLLRLQHAVYMPASGRINIAGLQEDQIEPLAALLGPFLNASLTARA